MEMQMHKDQLSQELLERITTKAENTIRDVISVALSDEINRALTKALTEGEFYRSISTDLQNGLKTIYKEISAATSANGGGNITIPAGMNPDAIFSEASSQLSAILETTEKATESIMTVVEKHLDANERTLTALENLDSGDASVTEIRDNAVALGTDLMEIMTTLSFQDLTGQRIKRIVTALQQIEKVVFELYMATGLSMKAMEENPDQSLEEIRQTSKDRASQLMGPQDGTSQNDVDDLLAQLGM